ncbi:MAG: glycosyltransferase, partial [Candidatus Woesearchaeota archaeon]
MKILTYIQHTRLIKPTGIGNHIKNIIPRLSEKYDLDILTSEKYKKHKEVKRLIGSWDLNVKTYKTPRTIIDKFWKYLKFPKIDSLAENYDWIYNPAESYIPLNNKTKQAVTIHDARHFNKKFNKSLISRFLWKLYIERINKNVDIVFTVSEFSKKELIRLTS